MVAACVCIAVYADDDVDIGAIGRSMCVYSYVYDDADDICVVDI